MTAPLLVAVHGAGGRMGQMVLRALLAAPDVRLCAALDAPGSPHLGGDAGGLLGGARCGVLLTADLLALRGAEVVIDFSVPAAAAALAGVAAEHGVALVIGTTGLGKAELGAIAEAARRVPVVRSANMSLGVNVLLHLIGRVSQGLPDYDAEIVEIHHRLKRDAPSGTALLMEQTIAAARGLDAEAALCSARSGHPGPRPDGEIGVLAARGGDVVGEHTAYFFGPGERLEITHRASNREIFAAGALRAARWAARQPAGAYDMIDVLGLAR